MTKMNVLIMFVVIAIVGGGGLALLNKNSDKLRTDDVSANLTAAENLFSNQKPAQDYTTDLSEDRGVWLPFDEARLADADEGSVVLYFSADWCPSCQIAKSNFAENANRIPKNLTLLDLDYDKETSLRKKYGVTVQHTFVQVDKDGNELKKWGQSILIDQILAEVEA